MFITFEGPEGSGKSTVAKEIYNCLLKEGKDVILTREPGGTPIAEEIRNVILDRKNTNMDCITEALLYAASRRQHLVEKVWPAIEKGTIVLSDRFLDSSLAYQGGGRGIGIQKILDINMHATEGFFPDLTLYFDIEPELGLERIAKNSSREVNRLDLEKLEFHRKVHETFLELAKKYPNRYRLVDATKSLNEVIEDTYKIVESVL